MRFSRLPGGTVILGLVTLYVLSLALNRELDTYIHPRYITLTIGMSLIAAVLLVIHFVLNAKKTDPQKITISWSWLPLSVVLALALLLPARSLTSSTITQRKTDSQTAAAGINDEPLANLFARSSRGLGIADWARLLAANPDPSYYSTKQVEISGFLYDAGLGPDTVWLARFVVTCCAVDAQPVGVPVHIPDWRNNYEQDQWLEVSGTFELQATAQGEQLVLLPQRVEALDEPDNPYAN